MSAPSPDPDWAPPLTFAVFDEFGRGADDRVQVYATIHMLAARRQALEDAALALEAEDKLRSWDNYMGVAARVVRALMEPGKG